jgi:hypothetical protein
MATRTFSVERLLERFIVVIGVCVLIGAAAALDDRVRDRATGVFAGTAMSELSTARDLATRAMNQAVATVGYQGTENGTLVLFVVAAVILFGVMLRT